MYFRVPIGCLHVFFGKNIYSNPLPIFESDRIAWHEFLMCFGNLPLIR